MKKFSIRLISIIAVLSLTVSLFGCTSTSETETKTTTTTTATEETAPCDPTPVEEPSEETTTTEAAVDPFELFAGQYDISEKSGEIYGSWWAVSIIDKASGEFDLDEGEEACKTISFYDTVGNPGIEGKIYDYDDKSITMEVDFDYFDQMPSEDWKLKDDKYFVVNYTVTSDGIVFENNGVSIEFVTRVESEE